MFEQITGLVVKTLDTVFAPIAIFQPIISLLIFSTMITIIIIFLNRLTVNRKLVRELKDKMEEIRENLTRAQKEGNREDVNKFLNELMKINGQYMKYTMRTLIVSMAVIMLFLPWLNFKYGGTAVAILPFSVPILGSSLTWIFWYALVSLTVGWIIKKLLGIEYA